MLSPNTQAVLLLTCHFGKSDRESAQPLSVKEWGQFAFWLKEQGLTPASLVYGNPEESLTQWSSNKVSKSRLLALLNRGSALGLSVEKWLRAGLWVITRSDAEYPKMLKSRLKFDSPPCLFGCGNQALLNQGGIAIVGSRNADEEDLNYSKRLGQIAALQGYSVISGGARGIDESAMIGALESDGTAVGIMADSLLKSSTSSKYRRHLQNNNLLLISPFNPEAGFSAGNAMQRNKYIYCMSEAAIAVHSGTSGGTWSGANENLSKGWTPLWTKRSSDLNSGNHLLLQSGAKLIEANLDNLEIGKLIDRSIEFGINPGNNLIPQDADSKSSLVSINNSATGVNEQASTYDLLSSEAPHKESFSAESTTFSQTEECAKESTDKISNYPDMKSTTDISNLGFYDFFLMKLPMWCSDNPCDIEKLESVSGITKQQLSIWLKKAMEDGFIIKQSRPVRYLWSTSHQSNLF